MYEALSYTWGSGSADRTIFVDGEPFLVRETLYQALFYLRGPKHRKIWADAICIDQNSVIERNHQVSLMRFVYIRAQGVLIFLDIPDKDALHLHSLFESYKRLTYAGIGNTHLRQIAEQPYWNRTWIIRTYLLVSFPDDLIKFSKLNYTFVHIGFRK